MPDVRTDLHAVDGASPAKTDPRASTRPVDGRGLAQAGVPLRRTTVRTEVGSEPTTNGDTRNGALRLSMTRPQVRPAQLGTLRIDVPQRDGSLARILFVQLANRFKLIVACAPSWRPRVETILSGLHQRLAARGIRLDYEVHDG